MNAVSYFLEIVAVPPRWYLPMFCVSHLLCDATDRSFCALTLSIDAYVCEDLKSLQLIHTSFSPVMSTPYFSKTNFSCSAM